MKLTIKNEGTGRIHFNPDDFEPDERALIEMYNETCLGCMFAEPENAQKGKPFCTYAFKRIITGDGVCDVKRTNQS